MNHQAGSGLFSDRISDVPKSFIREILKVAVDKDVISFAGGLPNRELFPIEELKKANDAVYENMGAQAFQYSNSEGSLELRAWIASRYLKKLGLTIPEDQILITSGSQQGLDLLAKTFLNEGDNIIMEEPGYLGAIQAFSVYRARFRTVPVTNEGMDLDALDQVFSKHQAKLMYTVPNFQNPSGISYSQENREQVAERLQSENTYLIEDDPYGDLRYSGEKKSSFARLIPDKTILLGSFSKTIVPSFRLGWIVAPNPIFEKLLIAKQASDLHTNYFSQCIVCEYLKQGQYDQHIEKIRNVYGHQRDVMLRAIRKHFPASVECTEPDGGMFLWVTLPEQTSSMELFHKAIAKKVAFVPGQPFYIGKSETNTLRLNFSCVNEPEIETGMKRLGEVLHQMLLKD